MLIIDNLSFFSNHKKIFGPIGVSVGLGCALMVTGQNGSGKSTLLKVLSGISKPSDGKIFWGETDVEEIREYFNADLQFIGHKNFLKPELTVVENLQFYTKLHDSEILIPAALKVFELNDIANEKVKNLSAGWQKKVMLSKLICCPATIWLLDEPSSNLDKEAKEKLYGLIVTKIKDGQGLVVMTTHDEMFLKLGAVINLEDFS